MKMIKHRTLLVVFITYLSWLGVFLENSIYLETSGYGVGPLSRSFA